MKKIIHKNIYMLLGVMTVTGILMDIVNNRFLTPLVFIGGLTFGAIRLIREVYKIKNNYNIFNDEKVAESMALAKGTAIKDNRENKQDTPNVLNDNEMSLFNTEINNIHKNIKSVEQSMQKSDVIMDILSKEDRWKAINLFHESLIQSPDRLTDASSFAYVNLPNLAKLTSLHVEFEQEEIKNEKLVNAIQKSEETIAKLSDLIIKDYIDYKDKELKNFTSHVDIINKTIVKQNRKVG